MEAITLNREQIILDILNHNKWEWTLESDEVLLIMQGDESTKELWKHVYSSDFIDNTWSTDKYGEKIDLCKSIMKQSEDEAIKDLYKDNKDSDFELCFNEEDNKHRIIISNIEGTDVLFGVHFYKIMMQDIGKDITQTDDIGAMYDDEEDIKELSKYFDEDTQDLKDNSKYRFLLNFKKVIKYYCLNDINDKSRVRSHKGNMYGARSVWFENVEGYKYFYTTEKDNEVTKKDYGVIDKDTIVIYRQ